MENAVAPRVFGTSSRHDRDFVMRAGQDRTHRDARHGRIYVDTWDSPLAGHPCGGRTVPVRDSATHLEELLVSPPADGFGDVQVALRIDCGGVGECELARQMPR